MPNYGLLIDYEYCTGCQSCIVSCKEEHDFKLGKSGINLFSDGPWQKDDSSDAGFNFNWNNIPIPSDLCDLCSDRVEAGREPICVHHCLGACMKFGTIDELAKELASKPKQVLWVPTA